jgi:hypothetical protein
MLLAYQPGSAAAAPIAVCGGRPPAVGHFFNESQTGELMRDDHVRAECVEFILEKRIDWSELEILVIALWTNTQTKSDLGKILNLLYSFQTVREDLLTWARGESKKPPPDLSMI